MRDLKDDDNPSTTRVFSFSLSFVFLFFSQGVLIHILGF